MTKTRPRVRPAAGRWVDHVRGDVVPWLLDESTPAVRAATLERLLGRPRHHPDVVAARTAAMSTDPIRSMLAAQDPEGWWMKPGPGYSPKYTGTVWQVIFLDQLGAEADHPQVRKACDYVLRFCATSSGGLGCSGSKTEAPPPPSTVIHCLNGNLLRALVGFGRLDDDRVQRAIEWAARRITGEGVDRWYASTTCGPMFACSANDRMPCAWGALKELSALARVPAPSRSAVVRRAVDAGVEFLFSRDPLDADYPMGWGNVRPSSSWFKLGFPSGYVSDVLQTAEVLCELGHAADPRLQRTIEWIESRQLPDGGWLNQYAYNGKTTVDIEKQGKTSKWVTLRACLVLRAVYG